MQSFYGKCTGANFTWSLKLVTAVLTLPKPFKWSTAPRPPPAVNVTHLHLTSQCFFLLQSSHCVEICLHVYFCYLIVRSFRARLEFMLSADRVPKLCCERMNHVLASRSSKEGKILEHWGCLRSLRDELEASVPGADSEHPGWEGCQELGPLRSLLPGSPAYPGFQRDPTSPSATAPSSDRGGQSTAPTGGRGVQSPLLSAAWRGCGFPRCQPAAARGDPCDQRKGASDWLGRGWGWQGRGGEGRREPSARQGTALLTFPHLHFLPRAQDWVPSLSPFLSPHPTSPQDLPGAWSTGRSALPAAFRAPFRPARTSPQPPPEGAGPGPWRSVSQGPSVPCAGQREQIQ